MVVKEDRVREAIAGLTAKPAMVVTDSQAFGRVSADTPSGDSPDLVLHPYGPLQGRAAAFH